MGSAPLRISRISENLRLIQNEISLLANEEIASRPEAGPLDTPDLQALRQMKRSIDHLRRVLRTYIKFADAKMGACEFDEFQATRIERTTRFLQYACQGLELREGSAHAVPSLFEQLTQMAFAAVDRHRPIESARSEIPVRPSIIAPLEEVGSPL
jgi:hypothetical protein